MRRGKSAGRSLKSEIYMHRGAKPAACMTGSAAARRARCQRIRLEASCGTANNNADIRTASRSYSESGSSRRPVSYICSIDSR